MTEEQANIFFESGNIDFDVEPCPEVGANMAVNSVWKSGNKWNKANRPTRNCF